MKKLVTALGAALLAMAIGNATAEPPGKPPTMQQVLEASKPADWRALDPANTLYMDLPSGAAS